MLSRSVDSAGAANTTNVRQTQRETGAQFRKHMERLAERRLADDLKSVAAPLSSSAPASAPTAAAPVLPTAPPEPVAPTAGTVPATAAPAAATTPAATSSGTPSYQRLSATAVSFLTDARLPMLELLPGTLAAGDAQYNTREVMLRERLNLQEVEHRLRGAAEALAVSYDKSDLEGVLRNAGYDAAHLGSTERYMAAIEKFVGEAENNYRQRAGNVPGKNA